MLVDHVSKGSNYYHYPRRLYLSFRFWEEKTLCLNQADTKYTLRLILGPKKS